MAVQGLYPSGSSTADFSKQIQTAIVTMKKVAVDAKIQLD
jgi:hypothetical protein